MLVNATRHLLDLPKAIQDLPKAIQDLPNDIQLIILEYMLPRYKLFLTKSFYLQYHNFIFKLIPINKIEIYIRAMVKQDNYFVVNRLVSDNWHKWLNTVNFYHKGRYYLNYIDFLNDYCFEERATKSKQVIHQLLVKYAKIHD